MAFDKDTVPEPKEGKQEAIVTFEALAAKPMEGTKNDKAWRKAKLSMMIVGRNKPNKFVLWSPLKDYSPVTTDKELKQFDQQYKIQWYEQLIKHNGNEWVEKKIVYIEQYNDTHGNIKGNNVTYRDNTQSNSNNQTDSGTVSPQTIRTDNSKQTSSSPKYDHEYAYNLFVKKTTTEQRTRSAYVGFYFRLNYGDRDNVKSVANFFDSKQKVKAEAEVLTDEKPTIDKDLGTVIKEGDNCIKEQVFEYIKLNDNNDGVQHKDITTHFKYEKQLDKIVDSLLIVGLIFEIKPGVYKVLK